MVVLNPYRRACRRPPGWKRPRVRGVRWSRRVGVLALAAAAPGTALAQEPPPRSVVLDSIVACPSCSIVLDSLFTASLPGTELRLVPSDAYNVRPAPDGSFVLALFESPGTVVRWSSTGGMLGTVSHELPGIDDPSGYAGASIDQAGRIEVVSRGWSASIPLNPDSEPTARLLEYANVWDATSVGGRTVVAGWLPTPASAGYPFHLEGASGHEGSFGPLITTYRAALADGRRRLGASGDSAFWAIHPNRRALDLWTLGGRLDLRVQLPPLPASVGVEPAGRGGARGEADLRVTRSDPTVVGVWEDEEGIVWILTQLPRKDYALPDSLPDRWAPISSHNGFADVLLEVINPNEGVLLTRSRVAANLVGLRGGPLILGLVVNEAGRQSFVFHRARIER